jgi:hypothetical protein
MDVQNATGEVCKATNVSPDAPVYFKAVYENHPEYFEKATLAKEATNANAKAYDKMYDVEAAGKPGRKAIHSTSLEQQLESPDKADAAKLRGTRLVSANSPTWFQHPLVSNQEYFERKGLQIQKMKAIQPPKPTIGLVYTSDGFLKKSSRNSNDTPDFMRAPMEANVEWYKKGGFGDPAKLMEPKQPVAKDKLVNNITGSVATSFVVSKHTPSWMKSPLRSNREYFEKEGIRDKLREAKNTREKKTGKKLNTSNNHHVSPTAPPWMQRGDKFQEEEHMAQEPGHPKKKGVSKVAISREAPDWMLSTSPAKPKRPAAETPGTAGGRAQSAPTSPSNVKATDANPTGRTPAAGDNKAKGSAQRSQASSGGEARKGGAAALKDSATSGTSPNGARKGSASAASPKDGAMTARSPNESRKEGAAMHKDGAMTARSPDVARKVAPVPKDGAMSARSGSRSSAGIASPAGVWKAKALEFSPSARSG